MHRSAFRLAPLALTVLFIALAAASCEDKPAANTSSPAAPAAKTEAAAPANTAANVLGKYENANDKITIELKADGKATMIDEAKSTDVTWEMDGADKLVVHGQEGMNLLLKINPDGSLSDNMGLGSVFRKK